MLKIKGYSEMYCKNYLSELVYRHLIFGMNQMLAIILKKKILFRKKIHELFTIKIGKK